MRSHLIMAIVCLLIALTIWCVILSPLGTVSGNIESMKQQQGIATEQDKQDRKLTRTLQQNYRDRSD